MSLFHSCLYSCEYDVIVDYHCRVVFFFILWLTWYDSVPFEQKAQKSMLKMDMFGDMREKERVTEDLVRVRQIYTRYKEIGKKNALMKASFGAFLCDITL